MNGLEQRIASALSNDTAAAELECLTAETEAAFAATTEAAALARDRALDPRVIDPAARAELTDVGFTLERLEAALPQLQARHREARAREKAAAWELEFAEVATKYNAMADESREAYPPMLDKLVDLCARAKTLTSQRSTASTVPRRPARGGVCRKCGMAGNCACRISSTTAST
jgi:hypothetical protein